MTLLLKPISEVFLFQSHFQHPRLIANFSSVSCCSDRESYKAQTMVREFDPKIPIEKALTPPSSWYSDPSFYAFELDRVFYRGWQAVGYSEQIKEAHDYFTGRLGNVEFVVCRDDNGNIAAFHNVCRHHASLLVSGSGKKSCFTCPYHGWTYELNGALRKATRISGIQDFIVNEFGLIPIKVATWGPFVLLNMDKEILQKDDIDTDILASEWLGSCSEILSLNGVDSPLTYVCRREYIIECNWKVFCDNYLDGGYHVPYAHKGLVSGLTLDSYTTSIFEKVSIQSVEGGSKETKDDRLGSNALYAFIYPNFMINRYGPWMDTNLVIPLGPRRCLVVFDYFLEASLKDDKAFIERSLVDSERVQMEDITLCEGVQRGIESPAYCSGRYAPTVEKAMHHFHCLLYDNLIN
ncbi:PREDICTED: choline monooxygenase, chloroplastic isoform X1 [Theobroma cacao]|uniref:Choline monooxygenase, chloroplastic n=1 Tax=Theobroma cacao TaxID=3641 RepID=A0AB32VBG5_THECC|nr:PREDICTED: choline monooxygenase, chloroplastic isoform X1 [Theobroma cacao]